jgi:predicted enzyme related to lactoylglutathione lyase
MTAFELGFFSLPVTDLKKARDFYGAVMGWDFKDRDPAFSYIFANGKMAGSLELASGVFSPSEKGPLLFFRADSLDKTLARVTANGGTVKETQAMEGGARGYTARISDPFGNTVAFWAAEK